MKDNSTAQTSFLVNTRILKGMNEYLRFWTSTRKPVSTRENTRVLDEIGGWCKHMIETHSSLRKSDHIDSFHSMKIKLPFTRNQCRRVFANSPNKQRFYTTMDLGKSLSDSYTTFLLNIEKRFKGKFTKRITRQKNHEVVRQFSSKKTMDRPFRHAGTLQNVPNCRNWD